MIRAFPNRNQKYKMTNKERKDLEDKKAEYKSKLQRLNQKLSYKRQERVMLETQIEHFPHEEEWKNLLTFNLKQAATLEKQIEETEKIIGEIEWLLED